MSWLLGSPHRCSSNVQSGIHGHHCQHCTQRLSVLVALAAVGGSDRRAVHDRAQTVGLAEGVGHRGNRKAKVLGKEWMLSFTTKVVTSGKE